MRFEEIDHLWPQLEGGFFTVTLRPHVGEERMSGIYERFHRHQAQLAVAFQACPQFGGVYPRRILIVSAEYCINRSLQVLDQVNDRNRVLRSPGANPS